MEQEAAGHPAGRPGSRPAPGPVKINEVGEQHDKNCGCETPHSHASGSPEEGGGRQPSTMQGGPAMGAQVQRVRSSEAKKNKGQESARKLYKEASMGAEDMDNVIWTVNPQPSTLNPQPSTLNP